MGSFSIAHLHLRPPHRHSCIGAGRGWRSLNWCQYPNDRKQRELDADKTHLKNDLVDLIKIVEGFYACGAAASDLWF